MTLFFIYIMWGVLQYMLITVCHAFERVVSHFCCQVSVSPPRQTEMKVSKRREIFMPLCWLLSLLLILPPSFLSSFPNLMRSFAYRLADVNLYIHNCLELCSPALPRSEEERSLAQSNLMAYVGWSCCTVTVFILSFLFITVFSFTCLYCPLLSYLGLTWVSHLSSSSLARSD